MYIDHPSDRPEGPALAELPADFVTEMYRQTAFIGAVLGGFATAFLGALVAMDNGKPAGIWAIGFATAAAVAFVVTTFGGTVVALDAARHGIVNFDYSLWPEATHTKKRISDLCLTVGLYTLLLSVMVSGWIRSIATGVVTTLIGSSGLVILTIVAFAHAA